MNPLRRRRGRAAAVLALMAGLVAVAPATGAELVRVDRPRDGGIVEVAEQEAAMARALARPGARIERVMVNERSVPARVLRRALSGRQLALELEPYLRPGPNVVTVRASRGEVIENESASFTLARRGAGLVTGDARRGPWAPVAIELSAKERVSDLRVAVNGRRVAGALGANVSRPRALLSATDGLRPGRNEIVVRALDRPNGAVQYFRRTISLPAARPVAGAGADSSAPTRTEVALSGAGSRRAAGASRRLRYRWRVVRAPVGADPELVGAGTATPALRPGAVPGRYDVRLTVTQPETGASSTDTVTVTTTPQPLAPITTLADLGAPGVQIQVDRACGDSIAPPCFYPLVDGDEDALQLLVLERTSLEVATDSSGNTANYAFPGNDLAGFASTLEGFQTDPPVGTSASDYIAIVAGHTGGVTDMANFNAGASVIGLPALTQTTIAEPFSVIGIPGMVAGKAWSNFGQRVADGAEGSLDGYVRDTTETTEGITQADRRVFDYGTPISFDTRAPTGESGVTRAITIGTTTVTDDGTAGILLVTFNRQTGTVVGSQTFDPLGPSEGLNWAALGTAINAAVEADQGIVLASRGGTEARLSGFPDEPTAGEFKNEFLGALNLLGVNPDVVARSILAGNDQQQPNDAFSVVSAGGVGFVGTEAMIENVLAEPSAEDIGFEQGRLTGTLRRAPDGAYQPAGGDPGPGDPSGFQEVLFQAPVAWPLTPAANATSATGEETALAYIATTPVSMGGLGINDTNGEGKALWTTENGTTTVSAAAVREVALDLRAGYQLPSAQGCASTPSLTYASITPTPPFTEAEFTTANTQVTSELNECRRVFAWFAAQTTPLNGTQVQETEQGVAANIVAQYFDSAESEQRAQAAAAEITEIVGISAAVFSAIPQTASYGKVMKLAAEIASSSQPAVKTAGPTGSVLDGWDYLEEQLNQETAAVDTQIDDTVSTITGGIGIAQAGIVSDWSRMTTTTNNIESGAQWQITSDQQAQLQDAFLMYIRQIAYRLYMGDRYTAYRISGKNADWGDRPKVENYTCTLTTVKPFNRADPGDPGGYGATQQYWTNNGIDNDGDPVAPNSYVMVGTGWNDMQDDDVPESALTDDLFGAPLVNGAPQFESETEYAASFFAPLFWTETFALTEQAHCKSTTKQLEGNFQAAINAFSWYPYTPD